MARRRQSSTYGFALTGGVLSKQIRRASESRGFAQSRVLTHWVEVAGHDIAAICRPVEISYGRGGMGATLTVLTTGAQAPMLEMQKEALRRKVNAVYGYEAVRRIRLTQTAATGFAEGQASFTARPKAAASGPSEQVRLRARETAADVGDDGLRAALERLATSVLSKHERG